MRGVCKGEMYEHERQRDGEIDSERQKAMCGKRGRNKEGIETEIQREKEKEGVRTNRVGEKSGDQDVCIYCGNMRRIYVHVY